MIVVGEYLKKARINIGASIKDISNELNISTYYLEAIENDDFSNTPGGVYTIGFIKTYADYLNLDSEEIIKLYKNHISFSSLPESIDLPKPTESFSLFQLNRIVSIFIFFFVSVSFYFLFIKESNFESEYAITSDIPENLITEIEKYEVEIAKAELKKIENNLLDEYQYNIQEEIPSIVKKNDAKIKVIASKPNQKDIDSLNKIISLRVLDSTWIQIRNNEGEVIYSKLMDKNDQYNYSLNDNFFITTGNAGNIIVMIGKETMGKLGDNGEVLDSISITLDYFSN